MRAKKLDVEVVRRMAAAGKMDREIAAVLGCSRQGVSDERSRLGLPPGHRRRYKIDPAIVADLAMGGKLDHEIAAAIGGSVPAVIHCRKKYGIAAADPKQRLKWDENEIRTLVSRGLTDEEIGKRVGRLAHQVYNFRRQRGMWQPTPHFEGKKKILKSRLKAIGLPDDLTRIQGEILIALLGGRKTSEEIRRAVGGGGRGRRKTAGIVTFKAIERVDTVGRHRWISPVVDLVDRGLIVTVQRKVPGKPNVYELTMKAITLMKKGGWHEEKQSDARGAKHPEQDHARRGGGKSA